MTPPNRTAHENLTPYQRAFLVVVGRSARLSERGHVAACWPTSSRIIVAFLPAPAASGFFLQFSFYFDRCRLWYGRSVLSRCLARFVHVWWVNPEWWKREVSRRKTAQVCIASRSVVHLCNWGRLAKPYTGVDSGGVECALNNYSTSC